MKDNTATFTYISTISGTRWLRSFALNQDFLRKLAKLLLGNIPLNVSLMILYKYS